jgi:hypothetical protein
MYDCILDFAVLVFVAGFCGSSGPGAYKSITLQPLAVRRAEAGGISGLLAACLPQSGLMSLHMGSASMKSPAVDGREARDPFFYSCHKHQVF